MTFSHLHFLVIGDVMLDEYIFGSAERLSPEAPVPVLKIESHSHALGGAGNVALNLAKLGAKVTLASVTGRDAAGDRIGELLQEHQIADATMKNGNPTITKTRFIAGKHQLLRTDREEPSKDEIQLTRYIRQLLNEHAFDAVLLSDYAKGFCSPAACQAVMEEAGHHNLNVFVDPKGNAWQKYAGAFIVTPNLKEFEEVAGAKIKNEDALVEPGLLEVRKTFRLQNLLVTRSEKGISLLHGDTISHIPAHSLDVFDVTGAGDTVLAVLAAVHTLTGDLQEAATVANMAAGFVISKLGAYAIHRHELDDILAQADRKIMYG